MLVGEREAERFFPALTADGGDLHVLDRAGIVVVCSGVAHAVDDEGDVAEADDVVRPNGHSPGPRRVPLRKVPLVLPRSRTRQPLVGGADFGMAAADGGIVQHDFQRGQPAGAQDRVGFPDLAFHVAVDATQANATFHGNTLLTGEARSQLPIIMNASAALASCRSMPDSFIRHYGSLVI